MVDHELFYGYDGVQFGGNCGNGYFLSTVLVKEIIRFVLVSIPTSPGKLFGFRFFDGIFAIAPNFIYDQFYVTTHGLHSTKG